MADTFSEQIDPAASIRSILQRYPYSVGLLREILQNSDDAKATKQIIVLDHRSHPTQRLLKRELAELQGPALLAFNDAKFTEDDWIALQNISKSSKKLDTSKIGKYGIGFRALYHVTDNPQILSHDSFVVFDPQHGFSDGGLRICVSDCLETHPDQLSAFDYFLPSDGASTFEGTVIRLPVRRRESTISPEVHSPDEIRRLLKDFVKQELKDVMLFLSHLESVEVHELFDKRDVLLGKASIVRDAPTHKASGNLAHTCRITVDLGRPGVLAATQKWRIVQTSIPSDACIKELSIRFNSSYDIASRLEKEKLYGDISMAIPLPLTGEMNGRLFTYLPLPVCTGFPCHIHALFALTDSRQNLRNISEIGVLKGSRDELLVQWNRLLFDTFIPGAWVILLETLVEQDHVKDIYAAWPPPQVPVTSGEPVYWRTLLDGVLESAKRRSSTIFPLVSGSEYHHVGDILAASQGISKEDLSALARTGLHLVQPPIHVFNLLVQDDPGRQLNPVSARESMLMDGAFKDLDTCSKNQILCYLLSTSDLKMLCDVPLIPLVSGSLVALCEREKGPRKHIMFSTTEEGRIFGRQDPNALLLSELPSSVAERLINYGESTLNVTTLRSKGVYPLITAELRSHNVTSFGSRPQCSETLLSWLVSFWSWFGAWAGADEQYPSIRGMLLVPGENGRLSELDANIFSSLQNNSVKSVLARAGLTFLHPRFPPTSRQYLQQHGVLKDPCNANDLLDALHLLGVSMAEGDAKVLRKHLSTHLAKIGRLNDDRKAKLRALAIYPVLFPTRDSNRHTFRRVIESLPAEPTINFVDFDAQNLLPHVQQHVFLPANEDVQSLVEHFDLRATARRTSLYDIVQLTVAHFQSQPDILQYSVLNRLVFNNTLRSHHVMHALKNAVFVKAGDGTTQTPANIIDILKPSCLLRERGLVLPTERCYPSGKDVHHKIIEELSALALLRENLTADFVADRVSTIVKLSRDSDSCNDAHTMSRALIQVLNATKFDCSTLQDTVRMEAWLPLPTGEFCAPNKCRDGHTRWLCDRILPVINFSLPPSLTRFLHWDEPIPLDILVAQLKTVTETELPDQWAYLKKIILEFGRRDSNIDDSRIQEIVDITKQPLELSSSPRPWIPVHRSLVVPTDNAVFEFCTAPGFYTIPTEILSADGVKPFLKRVGCLDRPSNVALLSRLRTLNDSPTSSGEAILLLQAIDATDMSPNLDTQILLPDADGHLRKLDEIYYNDLGVRVSWLSPPDGRYRLHPEASEDLARRLHVRTLSSLQLQEIDPDDDGNMREDLCIRISNLLKSYIREQVFNEFLANAADAGACRFDILLDTMGHVSRSTDSILPKLSRLRSVPAVIIHNDSRFTVQNFKSIRQIGNSLKQGDSTKIGKFGLGALSMYHFADMAMIVSGDSVMFLDPASMYLPNDNACPRTAFLVELKNVRHLYPVNALEGLFGFSVNAESYSDTIFWLPLRGDPSRLSSSYLSAGLVESMLHDYEDLAQESLFFSGIKTISAFRRFDSRSSEVTHLWTVSATRQTVADEPNIRCEMLELCSSSPGGCKNEQWRIVSMEVAHEIPEAFIKLSPKHRTKGLNVALAASTASIQGLPPREHRFYATLPLPKFTSLPLHVHAPFVLADDRRSIHFDENGKGNSQSSFNHWLLSEMIPLCLSRLLSSWPNDSERDLFTIWPGSETDNELSTVVSDSFYSKLADNHEKVCLSTTRGRIAPVDAVFLNNEPPSLKKILELLGREDLVQPPRHIRQKAVDHRVRGVDIWLVRDAISNSVQRFRTMYSEGRITVDDVLSLLDYMLKHSKHEDKHMQNLPLLPTADNALSDIIMNSSTSPNNVIYYVRNLTTTTQPWPLFPRSRFLHPHISATATADNMKDRGINVAILKGPAVASLIENRLSKVPELSAGPADERWIRDFWVQFRSLPVQMTDIEPLPLVRTTERRRYVSILRCHEASVLQAPIFKHQRDVCTALEKMGATIITLDSLAHELADHLRSFLKFTILEILQFLSSVTPLQHAFENLPNQQRHALATYLRDEVPAFVYTAKRNGLLHVIRELPIWMAYPMQRLYAISDRNIHVFFHSHNVSEYYQFLQDAPYLAVPPSVLEALEVQQMTAGQLMAQLNLPTYLPEKDLPAFERLLTLVREVHNKEGRKCHIKVPNELGVFCDADQLYTSTDDIFRAAFTTRPQYFLHPHLCTRYEDWVATMGLHTVRDFPAFLQCARVLHEDDNEPPEDRKLRALQIYEWYQLLPMTIGHRTALWQQLEELHFLPYDKERRQYADIGIFDVNNFIRHLPDDLATPKELVRPQWESIAWTQRARFCSIPDERLLLADLSLGVPTVPEVVEHLCQLACLGQGLADAGMTSLEVLQDLVDTYDWLETHSDEAGPGLVEAGNEGHKVFLNIDSTEGSWHFASAANLYFDAPDRGGYECVRSFLEPYKALLLAAGASKIEQADIGDLRAEDIPEENIADWRASMNDMRLRKFLTDAKFQAADGELFPVHRVVLASSSEYFEHLFCGDFKESKNALDPIPLEEDSACVRGALDHVYTGSVPESDDEEELLGVLRLAHYWELRYLHFEMQKRLVSKIDPGNYREMRVQAERYQAEILAHACEDFEKKNKRLLDKFNEQSSS
ncbi:hypothetical protein OBBRIDRAFT_117037 [Obba rivulosa]|uniref:BTB domain-containing protein n=1 Tax=Obba rivulosa TaxID=1052685 RepID=A0A8E2ANK1_9APHY|nr:hypothetical protein OBBRIDRAFT_117037 [Obba rivulosa]